MNQEKLWTKEFIITSLINFLSTTVFYLLIVIIGVYAKEVYHASTCVWQNKSAELCKGKMQSPALNFCA